MKCVSLNGKHMFSNLSDRCVYEGCNQKRNNQPSRHFKPLMNMLRKRKFEQTKPEKEEK